MTITEQTKNQIATEYAQFFLTQEINRQEELNPERLAKWRVDFPTGESEFMETWRQKGIELIESIQAKSEKWLGHCSNGMFSPSNKASGKLLCAVLSRPVPKTISGFDAMLQEYAGSEIVAYRENKKRARLEKEQEANRIEQENENKRIVRLRAVLSNPGGQITGPELIDVARSCGIEVHPRTAGSAKRIYAIGKDGARLTGEGVSDGLWQLLRSVLAVLN